MNFFECCVVLVDWKQRHQKARQFGVWILYQWTDVFVILPFVMGKEALALPAV
jgi:hypothetical protein